jgi:hypothetical protein
VERTTDARARAEAHWRNSIDSVAPLLSFGWTAAGIVLWLTALALAFIAPGSHPLVAVLGAALLCILTLSFSIVRILIAGDLLQRLRTIPDLDLDGTAHSDIRDVPAGLLSPQHAVSVSHLDRILLGGGDLGPQHLRDLRRLNAQAVAINLSAVVAGVAFILCGVILLAFVNATRTVGEEVAWLLFALAAISPVTINAAVLWAFRQLGLIEVARRFVVAQQILDNEDLPDDGSPLTVLLRRDGRTVVNPRALPARLAPRHRHFAAATTGRIPALFAQAWAFAALQPVVAIVAVISSLATPV